MTVSGMKIPTISIRHGAQEETATPATVSRTSPRRSQPFSEDALLSAWNTYISTHPQAHILINTMRAAAPALTSRTRFTVTVQNQIQLELMEANRSEIMGCIRDALANDEVDYDIIVNTTSSPRHTLTDNELLEKMKTEAPLLNRLIEDFRLHLA